MLNREFHCIRWDTSLYEIVSSCGGPINSKETEASQYLGATF